MKAKIISGQEVIEFDNISNTNERTREYSSEGNDVHKTALILTIENGTSLSTIEIANKLKNLDINTIDIYNDEDKLVHSFNEYNVFRQANRFIDNFQNRVEISFTIVNKEK